MMINDIQPNENTLKSEILGTKELAEYLHCSISTARATMYIKDFPLLKIGKNLRVRKSSLEKWLEKKERKQ